MRPFLVKSKERDCEAADSEEELGSTRRRTGKYQTHTHKLFKESVDDGARKNVLTQNSHNSTSLRTAYLEVKLS